MAGWTAFARGGAPAYEPDGALPILSASGVSRHLGVSRAVIATPYSSDRWRRLAPGRGVILRRDGGQEFSGPVVSRALSWDADSGDAVIKVQAAGDEVVLADNLAWPDPSRAPDDQTVSAYYRRSGRCSTAMLTLLADQLGPAAHASHRVAGLILGADPGLGATRAYEAPLFGTVLATLAEWSRAGDADLGVRLAGTRGGLLASLYAPRDLSAVVRFSAGIGNLLGFDYAETAPTCTDVVTAGQGDLAGRLRRYAATADAVALGWGRRVWSYADRRDTADVAKLDADGADTLADSAPTVSLSLVLADSDAATYSRDWSLGDRVTVHVGLPGSAVATVTDVVREIAWSVDGDGEESLRPVVGTADAGSLIAPPTVTELARVGAALAALAARK